MELRLDEVFRRSPNAYMVLDRELRYVAANDAYLRETASTLEALLGRRLFDLFPNDPDDPNDASRQLLRRSLERVLETGEADVLAFIRYRVPKHTPEGIVVEDRYWSATHTPLFDDEGRVAYVFQHTVDVTELQRLRADADSFAQAGVLARAQRVQDENALLADERRRLLHLFDQAPSFMAFLRGDQHVFEMANDAYREVVGGREVLGQTVAEALPEVVEQGFVALLDQVYRSGEPWVGRGIRVMLERRGGLEERYVDFVYQPIRNRAGEVEGIFVQGHDITDQKLAEAEVRRVNEALEQRVAERTAALADVNKELESFSYSVSHDLRAPLRHIAGFAQLLEKRAAASLDPVSREYLTTILGAAQQGGQLVDDLLAFSRTGRSPIREADISLGALVDDSLRELASEVAGREIEWRIGELDTAVRVDPGLLRAAMRNLLSNAIKYTRPRAHAVIEVGSAREGGEIHVWIKDNGVGFDMRHADKLFGVFSRLHDAAAFEGTGIGLANVRRIITRHGGRVWAEGRLEEGATFHFALPARERGA